MTDLKRTLDANGHCVLEMPSGTGKTVSLLSSLSPIKSSTRRARKLIYCSRTVPEIEKALAELKRLMEYRARYNDPGSNPPCQRDTPLPKGQGEQEEMLALGLSSRKNLCIHPSVGKERKGKVVDARCRDMTSAWACERGEKGAGERGAVRLSRGAGQDGARKPSSSGCLDPRGGQRVRQRQGRLSLFRHSAHDALRRHYHLFVPLPARSKVAEQVSKEMSKDAIVVFDEAHNIDNVCIESLSIDLTRPMLDSAYRSINQLSDRVEEVKRTDASKLQDEYARLVEGLQEQADDREAETFMTNPVLPEDLLQEAVPGNIRRAEHFVAFLKRFVEYLKTRMRVLHVVAETPPSFLQHLKDITYIERKPLRFCAERLRMLVSTLELTRLDEYSSLQKVAAFATLVATYEKGFLLILEPFETEHATVPNPIFHFTCLDASLAIAPVFERFSSVIITSGTISPLDMYPKMLKFETVVQDSYPMTLTRQCFLPLVITRGSDQVAISSRFEVRNDPPSCATMAPS
ncbi:hypothetical protein L7F22_012838 [Adiantum nelumboides]|nr:hypothetical protein [Adiantum nelumboides]